MFPPLGLPQRGLPRGLLDDRYLRKMCHRSDKNFSSSCTYPLPHWDKTCHVGFRNRPLKRVEGFLIFDLYWSVFCCRASLAEVKSRTLVDMHVRAQLTSGNSIRGTSSSAMDNRNTSEWRWHSVSLHWQTTGVHQTWTDLALSWFCQYYLNSISSANWYQKMILQSSALVTLSLSYFYGKVYLSPN